MSTGKYSDACRWLWTIVYYCFAYFLPDSYSPFGGRLSNWLRIQCVKHIFKKCGKVSTINRMVYFGNGKYVEIGDLSGIGAHAFIPNDTIIGNYVMMADWVHIVHGNHNYKDTTTPMCLQGSAGDIPTIIEDDCWIGTHVIMTPGRNVRKGSIVAAGSVLTKDFDEYSIVGGNPAKLIKNRKDVYNQKGLV